MLVAGRDWPGVGMRGVFIGAIVLGLLVGGGVSCFRMVIDDSGGPSGPEATPVAGTPRGTAEAFAQAWTAGNYPAMYALLDPASQAAHPLDDFAALYETFASETTTSQLTATVRAAEGSSASLAVHLATRYFGDIDYSVSLTLAKPAATTVVAWDPTALHPEMVDGQRIKSDIQRARRGSILDRAGRTLAVTRDVRFLGLNRAVIPDRPALKERLVAFGYSAEQVDAAYNHPSGQSQRVVVGPVADDKLEAVADLLKTPGVILFSEAQRVHPLGPAAAHVVGYTREMTAEELAQRKGQGYRAGDRLGATGLEASLEPVLAGKTGAELRVVDVNGLVVKVLQSTEYIAGKDVTTTLDAEVLRASWGRLGSRAGASVVIDPRSNAILALNSSPSFDPDAFERNDRAALDAITSAPGGPLANRATTGLYSAGSTFKLITGSAGMVYANLQPTDQLECGATWVGVDPPRRNWEGSQGMLTLAQALMRSCNPVFYEIGLRLYDTDNKLSEMARLFGFGTATGIVGLGEEDGLVPDAQWKRQRRNEPWYPGDDVNLAIGQGDLLITPLQLANAYSSFLSRQLRVPVVLATEQAKVRNDIPLTDTQWAHLKQGLQLVTGQFGTASAAFWAAGYNDFGGKSGTAEDAGAQQHVLFVAYSPQATPRAVAAVVLDEGASGSIEAGPIARDIVLVALKQVP